MKIQIKRIVFVIILFIFSIKAYQNGELSLFIDEIMSVDEIITEDIISYDINNIPEYKDKEYIIINNNEPQFETLKKTSESYEKYSNLDYLGRTHSAIANIGINMMPTVERTNIGLIKPSGWHTIKYDIINGKYLYNRCHLIAYQLTGENANRKNLITCTRNMNTGIMLQYENKVAEYIKETHNHVLYRVTPIYDGNDLLAKGIQMEALSIEDNGKGIKFNIFIYNVQEGITINYKTGDSYLTKNNSVQN